MEISPFFLPINHDVSNITEDKSFFLVEFNFLSQIPMSEIIF